MSFRDEMLRLQWSQLRHDELYHKDITLLAVGDRLKHMTLHFAKYVGGLSTAIASKDADLYCRTLVDVFVISLASSNILSIDLGKEIAKEQGAPSIDAVARSIHASADRPRNDDGQWFFKRFAQNTGRMAKACESLDHVEAYDFRPVLKASVLNIHRDLWAEAIGRGMSLVDSAAARLRKVEAGNLFHRYLAKEGETT